VKTEVHALGNAMTQVEDNVTVGNKFTTETPVTPKAGGDGANAGGVVTTTTTTTVNTHIGQNLNYVTDNNTNSGNPVPTVEVKTQTEVSIGLKMEIKTPIGSVKASSSVNQSGTITTEGKADVKVNKVLTVGGSVSTNSEGNTKVGVSMSTSAGNTTAKGGVVLSVNSKTGNLEFNFGVDQKVGAGKISDVIFVKLGQHQ
jgi:hypothetical protein